jgi:hypothetical protein
MNILEFLVSLAARPGVTQPRFPFMITGLEDREPAVEPNTGFECSMVGLWKAVAMEL